MSNEGFGRRRGSTLVVAAACVPAAVFLGWLLWPTGDGGDDARGRTDSAQSAPSASASPGSPAPSASATSDPSKSGKDGKSGRDGKGAGAAELRGRTVVIDPGHNPHNRDQPGKISRLVDIGTGKKECDTTGTATNSGYPEAEFTLALARDVRERLQERGAKVVFTQDGKTPYGPCVDERAEKGNAAKADAVISLHADGAPAGSRGFHVILPASVHKGDADTRAIAKPSRALGTAVRDGFETATGERPANYLGDGKGLDTRGDLGGLNLSQRPKVFLECGNMRDPRDAALLTSAKWRGKAARGITEGITVFLAGKPGTR